MKERDGLKLCTVCGCDGRGNCGRAIAKDGSIWPAKDTGFRMPKPGPKLVTLRVQ